MTFIKRNRILFGGGIAFVIYLLISLWIITYPYSMRAQASTWTVQTLKEYVDQRFESMQTAVTKAEEATEKRFEGVNEFRGQLSDQSRTFMPRSEYEAGHIELTRQISELKIRLDKYENLKQGGNITLYIIIAVVGALIGLMTWGRNYFANIFKPKN